MERFDPRPVIAAVRDGRDPGDAALSAFVRGMAHGAVSEAQAAAFAMAVVLRGLGPGGRVALTRAMRDSGRVLDWDLPGPVVDKHSTGGIGDCVSLILAPALAACGAYVPMISGRGLGHSGGTLDKLEAIPGFVAEQEEAVFRRIVAQVGTAIVGATPDIAPADRRLYAIRDVTATVESVDLITASILSKKLAAGIGGLVMDVKVGSGAFMRGQEEAEALARALVETASGAGCPTVARLTGMDQPLAPAMGNGPEVRAAMAVLTGAARGPVHEVTLELGAEALVLAGLAPGLEEGRARIAAAIASGHAVERFGRMVAAQGGPADFPDRWGALLPAAPVVRPVFADRGGVVARMDGRALGELVLTLGAGRVRAGAAVDPAVGLSHIAPIGTAVGPGGPPLALIHARTEEDADRAEAALRAAVHPGDTFEEPALFRGRIG